MRDVGAARHAPEDRTQARIGKYQLGEADEGLVHIMLWYGGGDSVQVSRNHAQYVLSPDCPGENVTCVLGKLDHEEATIQR